MKSKKMPRIQKKKVGYKLNISIRMITISVSLTTKLVVPRMLFIVFLISRSHGRFHSTESICGTWYHRTKTCMDHAEPQHLPPSPGGVVAIESPTRWGEGLLVKREPQVKALLWAWATCYLDQFFLGMSRQPEKSSFPGNPVTDVGAGQQRRPIWSECSAPLECSESRGMPHGPP